MHIAVCEDQRALAQSLCRDIEAYFETQEDIVITISEYYDGQDLLNANDETPFDVIFLDIELPTKSGMEVAWELRQRGSEALLIFVTAHSEFMAASFHVEAFDFLTKPVTAADIIRVLDRCVQKLNQRSGTILVKTGKGAAVVRLRDILYIASSQHYLNITAKDGSVVRSMMKLNQLEEQLKPYPQFIRCHQSYIVNIDYVAELCRTYFDILPAYQFVAKTIPVSRKYAPQVKDQFFQYYLN